MTEIKPRRWLRHTTCAKEPIDFPQTSHDDRRKPHPADSPQNFQRSAAGIACRIRRAGTQVQLGNADQACALITEAVPLLRQAPSPRNVRRALRVRDTMPYKKTDPRAKALDDQLALLSAA